MIYVFVFLFAGEGPFPGVIDMFGLAGGLMEIRAAMLAAHGFAALAVPFFRYDDLPKKFEDQTFDYFEVRKHCCFGMLVLDIKPV